jgi:hypothetical protein
MCLWVDIPFISCSQETLVYLDKQSGSFAAPSLLNVSRLDADAAMPGYLFMAPYAFLEAGALENEYVPFQAGPHI